jgi:hypothetical protein
MVNIGKFIITIIMVIVLLATASGLYPTFSTYIDNVTGSGYAGTALLAVASVLYWIIVSAVALLALIEGMGLASFIKKFDKLGGM